MPHRLALQAAGGSTSQLRHPITQLSLLQDLEIVREKETVQFFPLSSHRNVTSIIFTFREEGVRSLALDDVRRNFARLCSQRSGAVYLCLFTRVEFLLSLEVVARAVIS